MAEGEGFEPPEPRGSTVFKTAAIDHSATPPDAVEITGKGAFAQARMHSRPTPDLKNRVTLPSPIRVSVKNRQQPQIPGTPVSRLSLVFIGLIAASLAACASSPDRYSHYPASVPPDGAGSGSAAPHAPVVDIDVAGLISTDDRHQKVGNPYRVGGRTYRPTRDDRYDREGIASWYGPNFHGRPTANGEIFDQNAMTAAHTTLPIPSIAEVTNLDNGRSVIVRINDRGPFVDDRIIDLSRAAATELGYVGTGLARVRVRYLGPAHPDAPAPMRNRAVAPAPAPVVDNAPVQVADATPPATPPAVEIPEPGWTPPAVARGVTLQLGAFSEEGNAERLARRVSGAGEVWVEPGQSDNGPVFRVYFGRWSDRSGAEGARASLADWGVFGARIVSLD